MRIFVTGTGRCGTCTVYQMLNCISGIEAFHEGVRKEWNSFLTLPDNTAHVSYQFAPFIPVLTETYPGSIWIHLIRERKSCVESLMECCARELDWYNTQWFLYHGVRLGTEEGLRKAAENYYDATNRLIESSLNQYWGLTFTIRLETLEQDWTRFWNLRKLSGDFEESISISRRKYNSTENRGRDRFVASNNS